MKTVIYLANTSLQVVQADFKGQQIVIDDFQDYLLPEGTMLDGAVMDEESFKDTLYLVNKKGIETVKIVVDSGQTLHKKMIIPKMNDKEIKAVIKDEFNDLDDKDKDLIYDYTILQNNLPDKKGMEVLCCAMQGSMIESYLRLFTEAGIQITSIDISVNTIDKLVAEHLKIAQSNFLIAAVNGSDIALYLFEEGRYVFSNRSRIFSERGSNSYATEISNIMAKFKQFIKTAEFNQNIEKIYFCGLDEYEEKMLYDTVSDNVEIKTTRLVDVPSIKYKNSLKNFQLHKYIYAVGALIER